MSALIAFVTHYNFPFYAIGGVTLLLMWLWPLGSDRFGSGERPHAEGEGRKRPHGRPVSNPARSHPFPLRRHAGERPAKG